MAGLLLAALSGCGGSESAGRPAVTSTTTSAPTAGPAVPGITVHAYRTRVDIALGDRFQVQVHNTGAAPFTVVGVAMDSPGFQRLAPTEKQSQFRPGTVTDLRTPYGPVVCGPDVRAEPAYAVLDLVRPDRTVEQVRVPMTAPNDDIARMHAEECAALVIAQQVSVTLTDLALTELDGQPSLTGSLRLRRAGSTETVAVTDMRGSVVLKAAPVGELPLTMAADAESLDVPVYFRQATCDPHYLADTKQPVLFPLWLSFGGREQEYSEIPVTDEHEVQLIGFLADVCN